MCHVLNGPANVLAIGVAGNERNLALVVGSYIQKQYKFFLSSTVLYMLSYESYCLTKCIGALHGMNAEHAIRSE